MNLDLLGSLKKLRDAYEERTEVERERNAILKDALIQFKNTRRAHEKIASELIVFNQNCQRASFAVSRAADSLYIMAAEKNPDLARRRRPGGE